MGMTPSRRSGVMNEINVTPLVDVMLVLLIIFMITAPLLQQGLEVDLPETSATGIATTEDPFILVIKPDGKIRVGSANIPMSALRTKVSAIFKTRKNKQIYIQADRRVQYGVVAEAMAEIKAAGIHNMSLVTLPKGNR
jgi:biopolymer transport protein TolR